MSRIKAIVFDVYGTLVSTGTGSLDAAAEILRRNGREDLSPALFYRRWKALHREHIERPARVPTGAGPFVRGPRQLVGRVGPSRGPPGGGGLGVGLVL